MTVERELDRTPSWTNGKAHDMTDPNGDKEARIKYIEMGRKKLLEFKQSQQQIIQELQVKEEQLTLGATAVRQHEETLKQAVHQINELSAAITERDRQLQILSNELHQWHEQWQVVSAEMGNLQAGISQRDVSIATLQVEIEQHREAAVAARTKTKDELVCDMQDEVFKLQEELQGARERAERLQQELQGMTTQLQHEQSQKEAYRKLVEERDELIEKLSTHHSHGEDQELELQTLRVQLDQKEEVILGLHTQVEARDAQVLQLQHQEQELRQTQEALETKVMQLTQDTEMLVLQLTELKENRLEEKAMVDQMARKLETATQQKVELEKEMANAKHRMAVLSAKTEFSSRGGDMSEEFLVEELEAARAQAHQLATDLYELQQKYEEESGSWTTHVAEWEAQRQQLLAELDQARQEGASPRGDTGMSSERAAAVVAELAQKECDRQEAMSLAESRAVQLDQMRNELVALQAGSAEIHLQLQEAQQKILLMTTENQALRLSLQQQTAIDGASSSTSKAEGERVGQVAVLELELQRASEYNDLLTSTVQRLREDLQRAQAPPEARYPTPAPEASHYPEVPVPYPEVPLPTGSFDPHTVHHAAAMPPLPLPTTYLDVSNAQATLSPREHFLSPEEQMYAAQAAEIAAQQRLEDPAPDLSSAEALDRPRSIPRPVSTKSTASFIPQHKTLFSVIIIQSILTFFTGKSWKAKKEESVAL